MNKNRKRRDQFQKLGAAISAFKPHYDDRDYHTGKESEFVPMRDDRSLESWLKTLEAPEFKTPQWQRGVSQS